MKKKMRAYLDTQSNVCNKKKLFYIYMQFFTTVLQNVHHI